MPRLLYAYKPTVEGKEPLGTEDRILLWRTPREGFVSYAKRMLGPDAVCYEISSGNLYSNPETWRRLDV